MRAVTQLVPGAIVMWWPTDGFTPQQAVRLVVPIEGFPDWWHIADMEGGHYLAPASELGCFDHSDKWTGAS